MGESIEEILQNSKDLELIVSYYSRQAEKAKPHIKKALDEKVNEKRWGALAELLRKYKEYLAQEEKKKYVDKIIKKKESSRLVDDESIIIIEDFADLIDDDVFSSYFSKAVCGYCYAMRFPGIDRIFGLLEKHKEKINKTDLAPELAERLAILAASDKISKADTLRFESYLDNRAKCSLAVNALCESDKKNLHKIFDEYKHYLNENTYGILKKLVEHECKLGGQFIRMRGVRNAIDILKKDYLEKEQVSEFVNKIAERQFNYVEPEYFQKDPAGDIHEDEDPDFGLPYAFETLKQFPDEIYNELAKKIMRKVLAKRFYEEAGERFKKTVEETVKETIKKQKRFADKETVERALADAFREGLRRYSGEEVLEKFPKFVNREYIADIVLDELESESPYRAIDNLHFLPDSQLKDVTKKLVRNYAIERNFKQALSLLEKVQPRFGKEELSEFSLDLFEHVKKDMKTSEFHKEEGKTDSILEFVSVFSEYLPRNKATESFYQLLDLKNQIKK
jgi:hypothetical protein